MSAKEKTEIIKGVIANYKKISDEPINSETIAVITGLVFGELIEKAPTNSQTVDIRIFLMLIMRDVCESEKADPDHERTICINYEQLYEIVETYLTEMAGRKNK